MALEATDLMVVQKASGASEIRKATIQQLSDYLQTSDTVVYKGTANFTNSGEEPASKFVGDLYINNALATGNWAWSANTGGIVSVDPGDRAIWNGTNWDVIQSGSGDTGVEKITGTLPIIVDDTVDSEPNIEIREATTTLSGSVDRLATAADVDGTTGTGSSTAVVTADLLKETNSKLDAATAGGVTTILAEDPIEVKTDGTNGSDTNSPSVSIKTSAIGQLGAIQILDGSAPIGNPKDSADYATWVGTLDNTKSITLAGVATHFVPKNFNGLADA